MILVQEPLSLMYVHKNRSTYTTLIDEVTVLSAGAPRMMIFLTMVAVRKTPTVPAYIRFNFRSLVTVRKTRASSQTHLGSLFLILDFNCATEVHCGRGFVKFFPLKLFLVLVARDVGTIYSDMNVFGERFIERCIEVVGANGLEKRSEVLLSPIGKAGEDDVRRHFVCEY